jgi:sugar phosphate isomerase/epimerase
MIPDSILVANAGIGDGALAEEMTFKQWGTRGRQQSTARCSGHLDLAGVVATLRETGYRGYLSAELLSLPDPDAAAEATIEYMRQYVLLS